MSLSGWKQLECFAYWHTRVLSAPYGELLWELGSAGETKLMNVAPLYVLDGEPLDWYAEVPLRGKRQVDISAQYVGTTFYKGNLLAGRSVEKEGAFFHTYTQALAKEKESLLSICSLYLEADVRENQTPKISSFINIAGDMVAKLLPSLLKWRGREPEIGPVMNWLEKIRPWCEPWHIGFMEARDGTPLRLVLLMKHGLSDIPVILEKGGCKPLGKEPYLFLQKLGNDTAFDYMLDLDIFYDGTLGDTVGVEFIPKHAIWPKDQKQWIKTPTYQDFIRSLQDEGYADDRAKALPSAIFTQDLPDDTTLHSRISHFKLRWKSGIPMAAKVYVQIRSFRD